MPLGRRAGIGDAHRPGPSPSQAKLRTASDELVQK
jgi:hypothetical protein